MDEDGVVKYAKKLGFDEVYMRPDIFRARYSRFSLEVMKYKSYSGVWKKEISWASAGIPRPSITEVRKFIKMLDIGEKMTRKYLIKHEFIVNRYDVNYPDITTLINDIYSFFENRKIPLYVYVRKLNSDEVKVRLRGDLRRLTKWFNYEYYTTKWTMKDVKDEWREIFEDGLYRFLREI